MNMWIRMLKVALLGLGKSRLHPNQAHSTLYFTVGPLDLDAVGHMNNGKMITLMDLGKLDLMMRSGILSKQIAKEVLGVVTSHSKVIFRRQVGLFTKIRLESRCREWDDEKLTIEHILYDEKSGKVIAEVDSECKFLEKWKFKITPDRMWQICNPNTISNRYIEDHEMEAMYHS